jgi:hypothetical protein
MKNVSELIEKKLNDVSIHPAPQGNENKASRLRKIADKLSVWRASVPGEKGEPGNWIPSKLAEGGREAALESLKLLVDRDNNDLLHRCSRSYGDNSDCRNALRHIDEHILVGMRTDNRPLESFLGHGPYLALPGFIKDLRRWANMLRQGKTEGKEQPEMAKGKPKADSVAGVKRRGRKPLKKDEIEKRQNILNNWKQASECGISRIDFCEDNNITIKYLEICQAWERQRAFRDSK